MGIEILIRRAWATYSSSGSAAKTIVLTLPKPKRLINSFAALAAVLVGLEFVLAWILYELWKCQWGFWQLAFLNI